MRFAGVQIGNYLDPTNFDDVSLSSLQGQSMEKMYDKESDFIVEKSELDAESLLKRAGYAASATRAQGAAQGQASMMNGIASGIGGLASGFANQAGPGTPAPPSASNITPLQGPSYLNPNAPTSLAGYRQSIDQW